MQRVGFQRLRALDAFTHNIDTYRIYNPLFKTYTSAFDAAFDRGVAADLNYYILHEAAGRPSYEDQLANLLVAMHSNSIGKVYVLHGSVGSGKTTLCRYLSEKHPVMSSPRSLVVRMDVWPREEDPGGSQSMLTALLKDAVFDSFQRRGLAIDKGEFFRMIFSMIGFPPTDNEQAYRMSRDLTAEDLTGALIRYPNFDSILIIIDNIDETTDATIRQAIAFGVRLAQYARSFPNMPFTVLLPVREYTTQRFLDQDHFAHQPLPPLAAERVMDAKLEHARDEISSVCNEYTQVVAYNERGYSSAVISGKTITITRASACDFLKSLTRYIISEKEPHFREIITRLAGGNLKYLVGNLYNFLHSCKLPLIPLFRAIFAPADGSVKSTDLFERLSFGLACECLMATHYPFYDVAASHIVNIFNLNNSAAPNNFRNSLVIPRVLGLVNNSEYITYLNTLETFDSYGYHPNIINAAINKCLEFGLLRSEYGRHTGHFKQDSLLSFSSCGAVYFDLITTPGYRQYASEDTPMPEEFVVPLHKKYIELSPAMHGQNAHKARMASSDNFLKFVRQEEVLEREHLERGLKKSWQKYINRVGVQGREGALNLSDYIERHIAKNID